MNCQAADGVVSNVSDDLPAKVGHRGLRTGAAWLTIMARSFVIAGAAGAGQLGAAQALAMLEWDPVPPPGAWNRQLAWIVFICAASVFLGVAGSRRFVRSVRHAIDGRRTLAAAHRRATPAPEKPGQRVLASMRYHSLDVGRRLLAGASRMHAAVFASLGTAASFPFVWVPTRNVVDVDGLRVLVAAFATGIVIGVALSVLSLAVAPIATNTAVWLAGAWILGLGSLATMLDASGPWRTPLLGILDAPGLVGPSDWWLGPYVIVVVAVLFAGAVAGWARWVGERRVTIALSGVAGPSIIAVSYLFAGPGPDLRPHHDAALVAAGAGLLVSVVVAVLPGRRKPASPALPAAAPEPPADDALAIEEILIVDDMTSAVEDEPVPAAVVPLPAPSPVVAASVDPTESREPVDQPAQPIAAPFVPAHVVPAFAPPRRNPLPIARPVPVTPAPVLATPVPALAPPTSNTVETSTSEAETSVAAPAPAPAPRRSKDEQPRRARRRDRDLKSLPRKEREHVDWLEEMMSLPPDPTLLTRKK